MIIIKSTKEKGAMETGQGKESLSTTKNDKKTNAKPKSKDKWWESARNSLLSWVAVVLMLIVVVALVVNWTFRHSRPIGILWDGNSEKITLERVTAVGNEIKFSNFGKEVRFTFQEKDESGEAWRILEREKDVINFYEIGNKCSKVGGSKPLDGCPDINETMVNTTGTNSRLTLTMKNSGGDELKNAFTMSIEYDKEYGNKAKITLSDFTDIEIQLDSMQLNGSRDLKNDALHYDTDTMETEEGDVQTACIVIGCNKIEMYLTDAEIGDLFNDNGVLSSIHLRAETITVDTVYSAKYSLTYQYAAHPIDYIAKFGDKFGLNCQNELPFIISKIRPNTEDGSVNIEIYGSASTIERNGKSIPKFSEIVHEITWKILENTSISP